MERGHREDMLIERIARFVWSCVLLGCVLAMGPAPAGATPPCQRVAVLTLRGDDTIREAEIMYLTDLVRGALHGALPPDRWIVMTRENIRELSAANAGDMSQCEGECLLETGRLLGANQVVGGTVVLLGASYRMTLEAYDTESGSLLGFEKIGGEDLEEIADQLDVAAAKLLGLTFRMTPGNASSRVIGGGSPHWNMDVEAAHIVQFESTPPGATVSLDGALLCDSTPCSREIGEGLHEVQMILRRYEPREEVIAVGASSTVALDLSPLFGWLTVRSDPAGVPVLLDGTAAGTTPIERMELTPGEHRVLTADPGIHETGLAFIVQRGEEQVVQLVVTHREGGLTVRAEDDEGNALACGVKLNGTRVGQTPWSGQLWIGMYNWSVDCGAHGSQAGSATVVEEQIEAVTASFVSATRPGRLTVLTTHPRLQVTVNGSPIGVTPIRKMSISPGSYRVAVEDSRVQATGTTVAVPPGEEAIVELDTYLRYGPISVRAVDARGQDLSCIVKLDGERIGETPLHKSVRVGEHRWAVRCESLGRESGVANVETDRTHAIIARFQSSAQAQAAHHSPAPGAAEPAASGVHLDKDQTGVTVSLGGGVGLFDLSGIALRADSSSDEHPAPAEYEGTAFLASELAPGSSTGAVVSVHIAIAMSFFRLGLGVHVGMAMGDSGVMDGVELSSPIVLAVAGDAGINIPLNTLRPFFVVRGAYCRVSSTATPPGGSGYFYYGAGTGGFGFAWGLELIPSSEKHWMVAIEGMAAPPIPQNGLARIGVTARAGFGF